MRFVTLKPGEKLYHGSTRLYQIHCYIRRNKELLRTYLRGRLTSDISSVTEYVYLQLQVLYEVYRASLYEGDPVTKEILYLATVQLLFVTGSGHVSVYSVWNEFLSENDQDVLELLEFANDVEERRPGVFELMFYSSMLLPVQFFTKSYSNARGYAIRRPSLGGAVYTYEVHREVKLLDYDDPDTVEELKRTVFASKVPFSEADIKYYTDSPTLVALREDLLTLTRHFLYLDEVIEILRAICKGRARVPYSDRITTTRELATNWFTYFEEELITPYHLWNFTNAWEESRFTIYDSDALLLKVLIDDDRYQGYSSVRSSEVAIIDPQLWGVMDTAKIETDPRKCSYETHYAVLKDIGEDVEELETTVEEREGDVEEDVERESEFLLAPPLEGVKW
jgi:hypothetical protein